MKARTQSSKQRPKSAFAWKVFAELSESEYWFCSFGSLEGQK